VNDPVYAAPTIPDVAVPLPEPALAPAAVPKSFTSVQVDPFQDSVFATTGEFVEPAIICAVDVPKPHIPSRAVFISVVSDHEDPSNCSTAAPGPGRPPELIAAVVVPLFDCPSLPLAVFKLGALVQDDPL